METSYVSKSVALVASAAALMGCFHQPMRPAQTDVRTPPSGQALVVFIREKSPKDRFANMDVAVSDATGRFVATLALGERVAVAVPAGRATFVAFRGAGGKIKAFHQDEPAPIPAVVLEAARDKVYYIEVNLISLPDGKDWASANAARSASSQATLVKTTQGSYAPRDAATLRGQAASEFALNAQQGARQTGAAIGAAIFGDFGGTHMAPLAPRFGTDATAIRAKLERTSPREVDQEVARAFEKDTAEQYWWDHSWRSGAENVRVLAADALEQVTLHEADAL
jgi:hypothetical protein